MAVDSAIRDDIDNFLQAHYCMGIDEVPPDATLTDLGIDSLGLLTMADLIEKKHSISLDDERIVTVRTFPDLMRLIRAKIVERA